MDKHYSASTIAHEAKLYEERLGSESKFDEATYLANHSRICFSATHSRSNAVSKSVRFKTHGNVLSEEKFDYLKAQSKTCFNYSHG